MVPLSVEAFSCMTLTDGTVAPAADNIPNFEEALKSVVS